MAITIDGTNGFTTDNAALKLDGTTLVVDETNNRVGIGTGSPANPLHIKSSTNTVAQLESTSPNVYLKFADSNTTNGGFIGYAGEIMSFYTNNTERARIDSAGRVTMPYQPAFSATSPSLNVSGAIIFASALYNNGSHYSTSTGRFTAPVAGAYYFFTQHLANSGGFDVSFNKNGTRLSGHAESAETTYKNVANAQVVYMNANDYVYVEVWAGSSYGSTYCIFTGYLIG